MVEIVNFAAGDGPLAPDVAGEGDLYSIGTNGDRLLMHTLRNSQTYL